MNDLGLIVMRQGRYEEAEALIAEALATWRRVQHPGNADLFGKPCCGATWRVSTSGSAALRKQRSTSLTR